MPVPQQVLSLGAPSAGAFRKQCSALFLATGPREANASRTAAQHEPAPQGMVRRPQAFPPHTTQKKTRKRNRSQVFHLGAPSGTRTQGPLIKSQLLYQLS